MPDVISQLAIRRDITLCDLDVRTCERRGQDAARNITRQVYADLSALDPAQLQASVDDLLSAKRDYAAFAKKRRELAAALGE